MEDNFKSMTEVENLLNSLNLPEYIPFFMGQDITETEVLATLSEEDLERIGVSSLGHRKKILLACKNKIDEERPTPEPSRSKSNYEEESHTSPKKSGGGIWAFVGVLIAIVLIIIIAGSL